MNQTSPVFQTISTAIIISVLFVLAISGVLFSNISQKNYIALLVGSMGTGIIITMLWSCWKKRRRVVDALQQLAQGQFDSPSKSEQHQPWMKPVSAIQLKMNEAAEFIETLGKANDLEEFQYVDPKEQLGQALLGMKKTVQSYQLEEEKRNWSAEGLAYFDNLLKNHTEDISVFSDQVIRHLVKYLEANQGALFVKEQTDEEEFLELEACYAYDKKRDTQKRLAMGQSLVGQCAVDRKMIKLTQVPDQYTAITSGLGEATPNNLIIVPLLFNEKVYGVIEVASFTVFEDYKVTFLEKLAESIAASLSIVQTSAHMRKLLRDSQQQAEELERLSLVANNTDNSVVITDKYRRIEFVNQGFTNLTGYTADEVLGEVPGSLLQGPATDPETIKKISRQLNEGVPLSEEILNYRKNGESYWISLMVNPIKDEAGNIEKFVSIQADVTKIKEKTLDYTYKLEAISRSNAVIEFDTQGIIVGANDLYLNITGYEIAELLGKSYSYLLPDAEVDQPQIQMMWDNLKAGTFFSGEFKQKSKDGKELWLSGTYNPIFDLENKLRRIMMFAQFTTHEKEKQNDLAGMVQALISTIMTFEMTVGGNIKKANLLFLQRTGYKRREISSLKLTDLMEEGDQLPEIATALQQQESFSYPLTLLAKSGEAISCQCSFASTRNLEGRLNKIVVVVQEKELMLK